MDRDYIIYDGSEIIEQSKHNTNWTILRKKRDTILTETDWRFMSDQSPSQEWIDYRQFLRDLPQNFMDESDEVSQGANAAADAWVEYEKPEGA